jgi:hypothetical protein
MVSNPLLSEYLHIFFSYVSTPYIPIGVLTIDSGQILPKSGVINDI